MHNHSLLLTHDPRADAAFLYLRHPITRGDVVRAEVPAIETPPRSSIILNFDEYDRLLSIEVLGASKLLPPELLQPVEAGAPHDVPDCR
jgi:uncharacterized protein YuzE